MRLRRRLLPALLALAAAGAGGAWPAQAGPGVGPRQSCDWAQFGHDAGHSFAAAGTCAGITPTSVRTLAPRWVFHTTDSVTASPAIVGGSVYVGSWDGTFYALDAASGRPRWQFRIRTATQQAFGRIVSSAAVVPLPDPTAPTGRRLVVVFGGGSTLWVLDAATGRELTSLDVDPRTPALRAKEAADPPTVEIESSPAVADVVAGGRVVRRVFVGMDTHDEAGVGPTGVVTVDIAADRTGRWSAVPAWKSDGETGAVYTGVAGLTAGSGTGEGCGGVWSSPVVDPVNDVVVYGTGSCSHVTEARAAGLNWAESMVAVQASTGRLLWRYRPADEAGGRAAQDAAAHADDDFGASPNLLRLPNGALLAGEGQKSSVYRARFLATGRRAWATATGQPGNLSNDFAIGGFLGTTAVLPDARGRAAAVVGATAVPIPHATGDLARATVAVRSLDATTGRVLWESRVAAPSYASASTAGGVVFVPDTFSDTLLALDAATGAPLAALPLVGPPASAAAVGDGLVCVGSGTRETDLEYKSVHHSLQDAGTTPLGPSPLSPLSGVTCLAPALPAG